LLYIIYINEPEGVSREKSRKTENTKRKIYEKFMMLPAMNSTPGKLKTIKFLDELSSMSSCMISERNYVYTSCCIEG
jgi:hypothetical protein